MHHEDVARRIVNQGVRGPALKQGKPVTFMRTDHDEVDIMSIYEPNDLAFR